MTIILYPKCSTCNRAKKYLEEKLSGDMSHGVLEVRDIKNQNPTFEELGKWLKISGLPVKKFFNTSGVLYRELGLKDRLSSMSDDEALRLLSTDGMLVKRPILLAKDRVFVGFNEKIWETLFEA